MPAVVARMAGGLGNQLFIYACARRLSTYNRIPLLIDAESGYRNDAYRQRYQLDHFSIDAERAAPKDCFAGVLGRQYRSLLMKLDRHRSMSRARFVSESRDGRKLTRFDPNILTLKIRRKAYLSGLWQSENYFKDIESTLRADLEIKTSLCELSADIMQCIRESNSVCLHARRLHLQPIGPGARPKSTHQVSDEYYARAIAHICDRVADPHFFCFSDYHAWPDFITDMPNVTFVRHDDARDQVIRDFHLMSRCKHFITANSTFSWWAAWLGDHLDKIVIAPRNELEGERYSNNRDLIPDGWIVI